MGRGALVGGRPGVAIQRFTADGLTVIVLCNRADVDATALALKIAGFYLAGGK